MMKGEHIGTRRTAYDNGAVFIAACPHCGRFVKADASVFMNERGDIKPNATCRKDGRVVMPFEGYHG